MTLPPNGLHFQKYAHKVQGVGKPLAYWPLQEETGAVAYDWSEQARNAAYSNVTLKSTFAPGRTPCPSFNGTTSYVDLYTASLAAAFDGQAFSFSAWCRVGSAGVWTDGAQRNIFTFQADANNYIAVRKATTNNRLQVLYSAGGTLVSQALALNPTAFFHVGMTVSLANDRVIAYINGAAQTPLTGLGTFAGSPASSSCILGAASTAPAFVWSGWLAHAAVYDFELPADLNGMALLATQ